MASPFNPFAGRGQSAGEASTAGRGRGSTRGSLRGGTDRANKRGRGRGRGRGAGQVSTSRGRGAGAAARGASHAASSTPTPAFTNVTSSPFAQLTQSNESTQPAPPVNPFAIQQPRSKSPMAPLTGMSGGATRNNAFGPGAAQHLSRKSPAINGHGDSEKTPLAGQTSLSASYQDRYDQVSRFYSSRFRMQALMAERGWTLTPLCS